MTDDKSKLERGERSDSALDFNFRKVREDKSQRERADISTRQGLEMEREVREDVFAFVRPSKEDSPPHIVIPSLITNFWRRGKWQWERGEREDIQNQKHPKVTRLDVSISSRKERLISRRVARLSLHIFK